MAHETDYIERFALAKCFSILPRTVFVKGARDVELFQLASSLERAASDVELLGVELAIVAASERDFGGASGACNELMMFKRMAIQLLDPNGRPRYRFVGLLDNNRAGRQAIARARRIDTSVLEYKDVFCLRPIMPLTENRDPGALRRSFEAANEPYRGLDWELEDLISESLTVKFLDASPDSLQRSQQINGRVHRDWTLEGKAQLHAFVKQNAVHSDLSDVVHVLRALWHYFGMKPAS